MSWSAVRRPVVRYLLAGLVANLAIAAAPHVVLAQAAPVPPRMAPTQEYTILIFERASDLARRTDRRVADAYWTAYDNFAAALMKAGALRGGSALSESVQVTVRGTGGADQAVAGARLGGYFVIAAEDIAAARALAANAPAFALVVEVRPHRENPHMAKMSSPPEHRD